MMTVPPMPNGILTGHLYVGQRRMLRGVNIRRGMAATLLRAMLLLGPVIAGFSPEAAVADSLPAIAPAPAGDSPLPEPAGVVGAYAAARGWVDEFTVPAPADAAASLPIQDATGVCVILRHKGRVVGAAQDVQAGGAEGDSEGDLMVRRAVGRALGQVLGDPAVANLPGEYRDRIGLMLTVQLEVSGAMEPLLGRSAKDYAEQIEPGLDGLALRRGQKWACLFPGRMLSLNTADNPVAQLPGLAMKLGLAAGELERRVASGEVTVYRFRTIHLAQGGPDEAPFQAIRGGRLLPQSEVTPKGIMEFAGGIASHLLATFWPGDEPLGLMGTYRGVPDDFQPLIASPAEQALAAMALTRYAAASGVEPEEAAAARVGAKRILRELAQNADSEPDPLADVASCAAIVHAVCSMPPGDVEAAVAELMKDAVKRFDEDWQDEIGFVRTDPQTGVRRRARPQEQALAASAMARLLAASIDGSELVSRQRVRLALDTAWSAAPEHQHVSLLPWIGWGEMDYARATGRSPANLTRLQRVRELLDRSRVMRGDRPDEPDLEGGFDLTGPDGFSRTTSQSARPAAWLAAMLREPRLTAPEQVPAAVDGHLRTMRFLMQLAVREDDAWACRNPTRAVGGVRAATWDRDQPVGAQALSLLAASETLISLHEVAPGRPDPSDH